MAFGCLRVAGNTSQHVKSPDNINTGSQPVQNQERPPSVAGKPAASNSGPSVIMAPPWHATGNPPAVPFPVSLIYILLPLSLISSNRHGFISQPTLAYIQSRSKVTFPSLGLKSKYDIYSCFLIMVSKVYYDTKSFLLCP